MCVCVVPCPVRPGPGPEQKVTLDRATIERHLLTSSTDPFSRGTITMDDLRPNTELKQRIQDWLASRSRGNTPR